MRQGASGGRTAVQFGAGNVGLGFTGHLFHSSGLTTTFVDLDAGLVERLNRYNSYVLDLVGPTRFETIEIGPVRAVLATDRQAVIAELAGAELACTAVGPRAVSHVAPLLAEAQEQRDEPLPVLLCENELGIAGRLALELSRGDFTAAAARLGLTECVVSRMVPADRPGDGGPVRLRAEDYATLPVDGKVWRPERAIEGIVPVSPFISWYERKLYVHNAGHAAAAYLGAAAGFSLISEALADHAIAARTAGVMQASGRALVARYHVDADEMDQHVRQLLLRMANPHLADRVDRVARDPLRKLGSGDRLIGAARLCEEEGIDWSDLACAITAAVQYRCADDPAASELAALYDRSGRAGVLEEVCGLGPHTSLYQKLLKAGC